MAIIPSPRLARRSGLAVFLVIGFVAAACGRVTTVSTSSTGRVPPFLHCGNNIFPSSKSKNPFNPDMPYQVHDLTFLPLAYQNPHGLTSFVPQVATSWVPGKHVLTVHLRKHILWQDGTPLTSTDVVDSMLLAGVDASGVWDSITNVRAGGPHTVVFTLAPDAGTAPAEALILGTTIVPAKQYATFVPPTVAKAVPTYEAEVRSNPTAAGSSPAEHRVSAALTTLEKFSPSNLIGDGPFRLDSWTQSQALFSKSPTFFDASHVKVEKFVVQDTNQTVDEGAVMSGLCDQSLSGMPESIYERDAEIPGHHVYYPLTYAQKYLEMNDRHYPLNLTKVRQAIAYIVHRKVLIPLTYGYNMTYRFVRHPDLLYYGNEYQYVTRSQVASLKSYSYSPNRAARLLDSLGFKKTKGVWDMPNGKPFKLTMMVNSVFPNFIVNGKYISSWLSAFGIKTQETLVTAAAGASAYENGNFTLMQGEYFGAINPLEGIDAILGPGSDFISKTEPGLGFGPVENVPGIGKVDVPTTIQKDEAELSYGPAMKRIVWDWARFVNQQLPVISYGDRRYGVMFSTLHYRWPSRKSPLWSLTAFNNYAGLVTMLERGLLAPR